MMTYFCGWDGGGTKTAVCLTDNEGRVIAESSFGPLNLNGASESTVRETVEQCLTFMSAQPGGLSDCGGLVIGMAGVSSQHARAFLENTLEACGYQGRYRLLGDQEIALAGAVEGPGAILIAGTGSVCLAKNETGDTFRSGGYGYLIDDCGSGYAIGRDILAAVVRAEDGRGPATCLTEAVYRELSTENVGQMITWLYSPDTGKKEIAALAALLPEAVKKGDEAARAIAQRAAEDLSALAVSAWNRAGLDQGELALSGSILTRFSAVRQGVVERLEKALPGATVISPRHPAAFGAAALARAAFYSPIPS